MFRRGPRESPSYYIALQNQYSPVFPPQGTSPGKIALAASLRGSGPTTEVVWRVPQQDFRPEMEYNLELTDECFANLGDGALRRLRRRRDFMHVRAEAERRMAELDQ